MPGPIKLKPDEEKKFQAFYAKQAEKWNLSPNPDDPEHHYDYRAAWKAGEVPDENGHWSSRYKSPDHPRRYLPIGPNGEMVDTTKPMPDTKKDTKHEELLKALRALEAQKMAQMAALQASPAPAAGMYAPLVQAVRSQPNKFVPRSAKDAEEYGRRWNEQRAREVQEDLIRSLGTPGHPLGKPDTRPPGTVHEGSAPIKAPYKLAPEMKIQASPQVDVNLDDIRGRGNPIKYIPTAEYPGQTGTYMNRAADTVYEPMPKSPEEKQQIIEDELQQRKWDRRLVPEFQTPSRRIVYPL